MSTIDGRDRDRAAQPSRRSPGSPACPARRSRASSTRARASAPTSAPRWRRPSASWATRPTGRPAASSPAGATRSLSSSPSPRGRLFSDPFFPRLVRGVSRRPREPRPAARPADARARATRSRAIRYLTGGHVDGALLVSLHGDDPIPAALARARRAVRLRRAAAGRRGRQLRRRRQPPGRPARDAPPPAARAAASSRRSPAPWTCPRHRPPRRLPGGPRRRRPRRPRPRSSSHGDFTYEGGAAAMERLLRRAPDLDAVFAASDLMAAGALGVLVGARPPRPGGRGRRRLRRLPRRGLDPAAPHQRPPAHRGDGPGGRASPARRDRARRPAAASRRSGHGPRRARLERGEGGRPDDQHRRRHGRA